MPDWVLAWNEAKNVRLRAERGISFEDVEAAIDNGCVLDDFVHPDPERYPGQRVLVVEIRGYAFLVPYVVDDGVRFLKTIFPSRKAQRRYRNR